MLKDLESINSGSLVLLSGQRWEVKSIFAKDFGYLLQLLPAGSSRHASEAHRPAPVEPTRVDIGPDAMILTFPECLHEKQFVPVLDTVAKALVQPGEYRTAALTEINNYCEDGASEAQMDALWKLREGLRILTAQTPDRDALKKARDAAYQAAADHEHDMQTNPAYRAAAKLLESSPDALVDRVLALEKALEDMLTSVVPHTRDTGHNAADREMGEAIRNAKKLLGRK